MPLPPSRLIDKISQKAQSRTYIYGKRPFGVGLLICCYDQAGPHLFETRPSGDYFEYEGFSIGDKSQSSRTYFENNLDKYKNCDLEHLIMHGLKALKAGYRDDEELTGKNVEVAYVSKDGFVQCDENAIGDY